MAGMKDKFPGVFAKDTGYQITPDEIDMYQIYSVTNPSIAANFLGNCAAGTSAQAKAYVVVNKMADYPRTLAGAVAGSSDMGGVWALNGKNQFGVAQAETITIGSAANGGTTSGTKVFAEVTSGTFTFTTGAVGSGTPSVGFAIVGTAAKFGLPNKIASTADVKSVTWINGLVVTTLNGGTCTGHVSADTHSFWGTATLTGTQTFNVLYKPSYDASGAAVQANL